MAEHETDNKFCSGTGSAPTEKGQIDVDFLNLRFFTNCSIRYHSKRKRFFENFHHITTAGSVITGGSAFAALWSNGNNNILALWLTASVASLCSLDLVLQFSKRASTHDDLRKRFSVLLREIICTDKSVQNYQRLAAEKIMIEMDEPTSLKVLSIHCHNEEAVAQGYGRDQIYYLGRRVLLKDFWAFEGFIPVSLQKRDDLEKVKSPIS